MINFLYSLLAFLGIYEHVKVCWFNFELFVTSSLIAELFSIQAILASLVYGYSSGVIYDFVPKLFTFIGYLYCI